MDEADDDRIPLSALQHHTYCPRQCGLIHIESVWEENLFTMRGRRLHSQVDAPGYRVEDGQTQERALPLWSQRLGLVGKADLVVFRSDGTPFPVEYKSGRQKERLADRIQVCAQGLCLEEMTGRTVPAGAIFYHASRRRVQVEFSPLLRQQVEATVDAVRKMLASQRLPPPAADARCHDCSLLDACIPFALGRLSQRCAT